MTKVNIYYTIRDIINATDEKCKDDDREEEVVVAQEEGYEDNEQTISEDNES